MPLRPDDKVSNRPTVRSRELRNQATDAERKLWSHIRARQLSGIRFNRQFPIGAFICDFVSRGARLVIEVDGGQHDRNASADARRTAFLESQGYRVIRFWNNDVLQNIDGVLLTIQQNLDSPSPNPSREREGDLTAPLPSREREGLGEGLFET